MKWMIKKISFEIIESLLQMEETSSLLLFSIKVCFIKRKKHVINSTGRSKKARSDNAVP
jgi:hypothetical protein